MFDNLFKAVNLKMMVSIKSGKNRCQVCGEWCPDNLFNCSKHLGIRQKTVALARYVYCLKDETASFNAESINILAEAFEVSGSTVRKYLKDAGYSSIRGWMNKDFKPKKRK